MASITIDSRRVWIKDVPDEIRKSLDTATSYKVMGHVFAPSFRDKVWDGREHLLKYSMAADAYNLPVGMLEDAQAHLKAKGCAFEIHDERVKPVKSVTYDWKDGLILRPYQVDTIKKLAAHSDGIADLPIRSGKTKTAAGLIRTLGVKTMFIVPSKHLLHQTVESLQDALQCAVGVIGDAEWNLDAPVVVAMVHSLAALRKPRGPRETAASFKARRKRRKDAFDFPDCVIFDECHHLTADDWRDAIRAFKCYYRYGLSATVLLDHDGENEKGVIWLRAVCGPVRKKIDISYLIEQGYLIRPTFHLYKIREPAEMLHWRWSGELLEAGMTLNPVRNAKISELADLWADAGKRVLVVSSRIAQVDAVIQGCRNRADYIVGKVAMKSRKAKIDSFTSKAVPIMVGTVFGEGVDIPEIEVVINAEGGKDPKSAMQRLRNLTPNPAENKKDAIVIDFMDMFNTIFAEHSRARLAEYRLHRAFRFKVQKDAK